MSRYVDIKLNDTNIRNLNRRVARRSVERVTQEALVEAKLAAMGPYATGDLASRISSDIFERDRRVVGRITSSHPRTVLVHDGAQPHPIHPIAPDGTLVFFWRKVGHVVHFKRPHIRMHPGMRGKRFLSGPLERVGRRHRYITFTFGH